jgi:hypothetical protein
VGEKIKIMGKKSETPYYWREKDHLLRRFPGNARPPF